MAWVQVYQFNTGTTGSGAPGPQGPPGQAGASILSISSQPTPFQGNLGDLAIQSNGQVWQKQSGFFGKPPSWVKVANTVGPPGPAGKDGKSTVGPPGPAGQKGADGSSVSLAIGQPVGSGSSGSVLFVDASGNLAQNNANFFWDAGFLTLLVPNLSLTSKLKVGATPAFGTANQLLGIDPNGNVLEYKTVASADGSLIVTLSAGAIDLKVPAIPPITNATPGQKGQDGATWLVGSKPPTPSLGNVSDLYLQTNGNVWRKEIAAFGMPPAWVLKTNLLGPSGPAGKDGRPGQVVMSGGGGGGSSVVFAVQADMEAASSTSVAVPPAMVKHDLGVAKVVASMTFPAGVPTLDTTNSRNVASLTNNAAGDVTINFTTSFSTSTYAVICVSEWDSGFLYGQAFVPQGGKATGSVRIKIFKYNFVDFNYPISLSVVCYGDF